VVSKFKLTISRLPRDGFETTKKYDRTPTQNQQSMCFHQATMGLKSDMNSGTGRTMPSVKVIKAQIEQFQNLEIGLRCATPPLGWVLGEPPTSFGSVFLE